MTTSVLAVNSSTRVRRSSTHEYYGVVKDLRIGTEAYLEPSRTSTIELFCEISR